MSPHVSAALPGMLTLGFGHVGVQTFLRIYRGFPVDWEPLSKDDPTESH